MEYLRFLKVDLSCFKFTNELKELLHFSHPSDGDGDDSDEFDRNFSDAFDSNADKTKSWDRLRCCYTQVRVLPLTRVRQLILWKLETDPDYFDSPI